MNGIYSYSYFPTQLLWMGRRWRSVAALRYMLYSVPRVLGDDDDIMVIRYGLAAGFVIIKTV